MRAKGHSRDPGNGCDFFSQAYRATDSKYDRRVAVSVLWGKMTKRIVNNSDDDIMRIFNREFDQCTNTDMDLYPKNLYEEIDHLNDIIDENVNDGIYRAGFATSQVCMRTL